MNTPKHVLDLELVPDDVIEVYAGELFREQLDTDSYYLGLTAWNALSFREKLHYYAEAEKELVALEWKNLHDPDCSDDYYDELREKLGIVVTTTPQD